MKVLLNGGVAKRGMELLSERFGDRLSLRQMSDGTAPEDHIRDLAWAQVMISVNYDADFARAAGYEGPICH
ncbi:MAG: hypothetical protein OSB82_21910, partial [Alphaproteobacteria bacterium]|nr:hypothetical protein [Alphaproteobacteria bacterium]